MKAFKTAVVFLTCATLFFQFSGCYNNIKEVAPMVDVRIPDMRNLGFSQSEITLFMNEYGMSGDLKATNDTLETLRGLNKWPDKMYQIVLMLQEDQIPDDMYRALARGFLLELNIGQMEQFLEQCFDTYEYENDSGYALLKINENKYEKIRNSMEQLVFDNKYNDRDMLHKYGMFVSIKYIPALISKNPKGFQAFSITECVDLVNINYEQLNTDLKEDGQLNSGLEDDGQLNTDLKEDEDTIPLNSLVISYIGVSQNSQNSINESPQDVKIYQPAMDVKQLMNLSTFITKSGFDQLENALKTEDSILAEELKRETKSESEFSNMCVQLGYAYAKVSFSDESIWPLRIVFPKEPTANVLQLGEWIDEDKKSVIIVAE